MVSKVAGHGVLIGCDGFETFALGRMWSVPYLDLAARPCPRVSVRGSGTAGIWWPVSTFSDDWIDHHRDGEGIGGECGEGGGQEN